MCPRFCTAHATTASIDYILRQCLLSHGFWKDQVQQHEDQGKLRTFKKFKTNLNFEEYLNEISNIKHRQAVTKLRISSHRLPVESVRYNNIPFNERTCKHYD